MLTELHDKTLRRIWKVRRRVGRRVERCNAIEPAALWLTAAGGLLTGCQPLVRTDGAGAPPTA